jgi:uncharacterized YceG family protein
MIEPEPEPGYVAPPAPGPEFDDEEIEWEMPRRHAPATPVSPDPASEAVLPDDTDDTADAGAVATEDRPLALRRVGAPSVSDLPKIAGPPARGVPARRRGMRRVIPVLVLLIVLAVGWFTYRVFQPFAGDGTGSVRVAVPRGATASDVSKLLADRGVIDSAFFFDLRTRLSGRRADLKAGTFTLKRDMSYVAALDALTTTPKAAPVTRITIPEGRSISETAPLVRETSLSGSYVRAARRSPRTISGLRNFGVPKGTKTLEGFLFPATYELKAGSSARDLTNQQLQAFRRSFGSLDLGSAKRANLTRYDVLIIASMIEREAGVAKDRRLVSAVIYNRLRAGMPLGIDATIRYQLRNWSRPLLQSELATDSAFNTRKRQGLPPTPIGSPGLASMKAAVDPAKVKYLFYVVKPCGNGAHAFSATDAQFQKDVAAYNRKRAALGGKDPSHC